MTAARGAELRAPLRQGPATAAVTAALRSTVPGPGPDRHLSPEIEAAVAYVVSGGARDAAESVVGPLA
jgi:histidine ammonia-lyase